MQEIVIHSESLGIQTFADIPSFYSSPTGDLISLKTAVLLGATEVCLACQWPDCIPNTSVLIFCWYSSLPFQHRLSLCLKHETSIGCRIGFFSSNFTHFDSSAHRLKVTLVIYFG